MVSRLNVLSRNVSAWIPAFAGMTNGGVRWRTRQPFKRIFVTIAHAGRAGTPRYEKLELWLGTASWRGRFCHSPTLPQRGTSPRTTFPHPHPFWIPAFAGMTNEGPE